MKIGITGQSGFIGTHLYNYLGLQEGIERIPFEDDFFKDKSKLQSWVAKCDAIVHLAAMNRHGDPQVIYDTNIKLVKQLISACEQTNSKPHILFSSSTQEERGNPYGNSKKEGRKLLEQWAEKNNAHFTGFVIPNVFGPFGNPYYNSFIATFCHQLTHGEQPKIDVDGEVKLIYVGELVQEFRKNIKLHRVAQSDTQSNTVSNTAKHCETIKIPHTKEIKVSKVLNLLESYKADYFDKGIIPDLSNEFEKNLFNTFLCYIDYERFFPFPLKLNTDDRGSFVETVKLNSGGQVSFSTTVPGITRGNHFHTRKAERFAVIKGKARIDIRKIGTDKVLSFELDGSQPSFVDMPVWYTHNITNIGSEDLYTIFWINEHFNPKDPDTYFEKV
ncbi:UDP-2-acetamido-2,6-beta-L-arabino-hexul-4-ose reductase [Tangfeifania diversioriginum]|uniref:UDP-2-acetamido-2,6-beta-L-arabino-hexul-4-ose reductase n=1 Tax=Tangfeifania diversioriginum TaxID=1168035 RepID=A0A1M6JBQ3_9BACT|nr:NAD-dependent epimerase/dehydratase family protein [Tangfeifania diversioriginum]SHJ44125.1 UDP-2-acetamido-2,6-beta-L-arabino-hexul-4-ose reductase [Tangfeifania diversioriginum]